LVDLVIGDQPKQSILSDPSHVQVGPNGRIYIADQRTHAVHVFAPNGAKLGQCNPSPEDLTPISEVAHITASDDGSVLVAYSAVTSNALLFDSSFQRVGWCGPEHDIGPRTYHFLPTGDQTWVITYQDIYLMQNQKTVLRLINRDAEGYWLAPHIDATVAPNGNLGVITPPIHGSSMKVSLFSATGEPVETWPVIGQKVDHHWFPILYDGTRVFLRHKNTLWVYASNGAELGRIILPKASASESWAGPFLSTDGKTLQFVDPKALTVHHYRVAFD
jgi:hypothetical protein